MKNSLWVCALAVLAFGGSLRADWGDLKLKFVLDGKAPALKPLAADKDAAVCGKKPIPDETFVVGPNGELANVLVYLVPEKGAKLSVHADYEKDKAAKVVLDNKGCQFFPHIATLRTGQVLELKNSDPIGHNSKIDFLTNAPVNPIIPGSSSVDIKATDIAKSEKRASPVSCSIHPWMKGWLLVQDHPYMGVSDETGTVVIKNVPKGKHTFQVWHETVGNLSDKNTTGTKGPVDWSKGKAALTINTGDNDLGTYKVKQ